jgi:hypothetical protein
MTKNNTPGTRGVGILRLLCLFRDVKAQVNGGWRLYHCCNLERAMPIREILE